MRKAQVWSTDVLLGVTIFIGGIALFYGSMHLTGQTDYPVLKEEAKIATHRLLKPDSSINILTPEKEVNMSRLEDLSNMEYGALRDALGIRGEYCVYLEDKFGRMILIANKSGIGNKKLNLSGTPCGELA